MMAAGSWHGKRFPGDLVPLGALDDSATLETAELDTRFEKY